MKESVVLDLTSSTKSISVLVLYVVRAHPPAALEYLNCRPGEQADYTSLGPTHKPLDPLNPAPTIRASLSGTFLGGRMS